MSLYSFTNVQIKNLKALINDATLKGSAARSVVELLDAIEHPVSMDQKDDLHGEHNDASEQSQVEP